MLHHLLMLPVHFTAMEADQEIMTTLLGYLKDNIIRVQTDKWTELTKVIQKKIFMNLC